MKTFRYLIVAVLFLLVAGTLVSVCREISKIHEESVRGTLQEVIAHFTATEPRGEIVIILAGKED